MSVVGHSRLRSMTSGSCPASLSARARLSPAMPPPAMSTRRPVRVFGLSVVDHVVLRLIYVLDQSVRVKGMHDHRQLLPNWPGGTTHIDVQPRCQAWVVNRQVVNRQPAKDQAPRSPGPQLEPWLAGGTRRPASPRSRRRGGRRYAPRARAAPRSRYWSTREPAAGAPRAAVR